MHFSHTHLPVTSIDLIPENLPFPIKTAPPTTLLALLQNLQRRHETSSIYTKPSVQTFPHQQ